MAEKPLNNIASNLSPGVATAAASGKIAPQELAQINAFAELKKTHQFLTTLPQNDAYRTYKSLDKNQQAALDAFFNPKYREQDKGFFGNILRSVGRSAYHSAQTFKEVGMQIAGIPITPKTSGNLAEALLTFGTAAPVKTSEETGQSMGAGRVLDALVRPQEKLIKQPYIAGRLAGEQGEGGLLTYGKSFLEGAKELLPGGTDATVTDNSQTWKKYWEQASDPSSAFDASEVAKIEENLAPETAYVAKMLSSGKNFMDSYDELIADPKKLELVQRFTSGRPEDKEVMTQIGKAVAQYEYAKISPGRDYARSVFALFPFEAEKAVAGDPVARAFFNGISGTIDFSVTFGLDPLLLAGKAKRAADVARFGLIRLGENPANLEKAWQNRSVRNYWDTVGKLFQQYQAGDIATKGAVLTRISERFPELSTDVAMYMAPNIKDADTALEFFRGGDIIDDITKGNAGLRRDPLIPRYTKARYIKDWARDAGIKFVNKAGVYKAVDLPDTVDDIARLMDDTSVGWAERIGYNEAPQAGIFAGRAEGKKFVSKDASTAAKIDRVFRQFAIAPGLDRTIQISDASSATQVFRLARTVLDKGSASTLRAAWIAANEGQRLLMYKGLMKTLAYGMGFDHTESGRKFIDSIDSMTKELYSVNQSSLDLGEFSRVLGTTAKGGIPAPEGVRKIVQDVTDKATSEGLATRLAASTGAEMQQILADIDDIKLLKAELNKRKGTVATPEEIESIDNILGELDKSLGLLGGLLGKTRMARKEIKNIIEGVAPIDVDYYNAAEMNGAQYGVRAYQVSQARYMPNLVELRKFELRGNIFSSITGKVGESVYNQKATDIWSYLNLYPRLGVRTIVEEVGTAALISGAEGIANFFKGYAASQEVRKFSAPSTKRSAVFNIEKEVSPLGLISRQLYKITGKYKTKEEIIEASKDPETLAKAIGTSMLKERFKPAFLQTAKGKRAAGYIEDFVEFDGKTVLDDINGAATRAEFKMDPAEEAAESLKSYGPSIYSNPDLVEALKNQRFASVFSQIQHNDPEFLLNWYLELNNTIGKKNIFGQIIFSNIYRKEEDAIDALVNYLDGKGNELAKRFAIYNQEGSYAFAQRVYADATSALRDSSGRLNKELIEEIRVSGGIDNFDYGQLAKYEEGFLKPKAVLGRKLMPVQEGDQVGFVDRAMKNGYQWVGRQIALLDREPITYANYIMYRDDLAKYQGNLKQSFLDSGVSEEAAEKLARRQSHEVAISLARQRTIGYMDNSDVRTNLAFNIRNFGRYYRATEDFYRRLGRLAKYEKRALVRLAVLNQTFEHSGFVHKDSNGEMYFTYPGDDILNFALGNTVFRALGIPGAQPMAVNFGGKLKMLTPSLDPESAAPRLGGPFVGISFGVLSNLPIIGNFVSGIEPTVTGGLRDQSLWRKITPINVQRLIDIVGSNEILTEQKFSATVQAMRLQVSTGQGPKDANDIDRFMFQTLVQATNIMVLRFLTGLGAPASVQMFGNRDVPKELINAGVFTWDSEFAKILEKHAGDPEAFSKALVKFSTLYPTKTVYAVSKTSSETEAGFQKTVEAANFVKERQDFILDHKQAASFFIPITGTSDLESYTYLKSQGFAQNKDLEEYLREASTAEARQKYNARKEYYDTKITETNSVQLRKEYREQWTAEQTFFKNSFPLLRAQLENGSGYKASKIEALDDLREVVYSGQSPDKKLGDVFGAMIYQYDNAQSQLAAITGRSDSESQRKQAIKDDLREYLKTAAAGNPNAVSLYWNIFDPLIGD
jgi:hypothetical protein